MTKPGYVSVLAKRMAKRNIVAVTATNGNEAIQTLRGIRFDCAVLDLKMEDMDGIEVLKIFKKMDPAMPVIMLTGHGSETAAREGVKFGAFDYLTKPCDLDDLIEIICEACNRESALKTEDKSKSHCQCNDEPDVRYLNWDSNNHC